MTVPMVDYPTTITDLLRAFNISEWLWALQNFQLISGIFFPNGTLLLQNMMFVKSLRNDLKILRILKSVYYPDNLQILGDIFNCIKKLDRSIVINNVN